MNILLYGATELGYMLAQRLYLEHSITLIDNLKKLPDRFNNLALSFVAGTGADIDALEQANVSKCELFVSCSTLDKANIVACRNFPWLADRCFLLKRPVPQKRK